MESVFDLDDSLFDGSLNEVEEDFISGAWEISESPSTFQMGNRLETSKEYFSLFHLPPNICPQLFLIRVTNQDQRHTYRVPTETERRFPSRSK